MQLQMYWSLFQPSVTLSLCSDSESERKGEQALFDMNIPKQISTEGEYQCRIGSIGFPSGEGKKQKNKKKAHVKDKS